MSKFSVLLTLGLSLLIATSSMAQDRNNRPTPRGLLDRLVTLPAQAANPAQQAVAIRNLRQQARAERRTLRRLNNNRLRRMARDESNRLAQMVLAERLAAEAQRWASVPNVGNDALSEALEWYALAARRGTPGSASIDQVLPAFPIRVLRP